MDALKYYEALGKLTVTNEFTETRKATKESFSSIRIVETANGANGDTNQHIVFDGHKQYAENQKKAISVQNIDTSGKAIDIVIAEPDESKGVTVKQVTPSESKDERMSKEDAVELLSSHWKKVQSEVNKMTDARKLNFLQVVAIELGVADTKKKLIETRLSEI
jgi:hypothetical protein